MVLLNYWKNFLLFFWISYTVELVKKVITLYGQPNDFSKFTKGTFLYVEFYCHYAISVFWGLRAKVDNVFWYFLLLLQFIWQNLSSKVHSKKIKRSHSHNFFAKKTTNVWQSRTFSPQRCLSVVPSPCNLFCVLSSANTWHMITSVCFNW